MNVSTSGHRPQEARLHDGTKPFEAFMIHVLALPLQLFVPCLAGAMFDSRYVALAAIGTIALLSLAFGHAWLVRGQAELLPPGPLHNAGMVNGTAWFTFEASGHQLFWIDDAETIHQIRSRPQTELAATLDGVTVDIPEAEAPPFLDHVVKTNLQTWAAVQTLGVGGIALAISGLFAGGAEAGMPWQLIVAPLGAGLAYLLTLIVLGGGLYIAITSSSRLMRRGGATVARSRTVRLTAHQLRVDEQQLTFTEPPAASIAYHSLGAVLTVRSGSEFVEVQGPAGLLLALSDRVHRIMSPAAPTADDRAALESLTAIRGSTSTV